MLRDRIEWYVDDISGNFAADRGLSADRSLVAARRARVTCALRRTRKLPSLSEWRKFRAIPKIRYDLSFCDERRPPCHRRRSCVSKPGHFDIGPARSLRKALGGPVATSRVGRHRSAGAAAMVVLSVRMRPGTGLRDHDLWAVSRFRCSIGQQEDR
jgi:hypothetical protein